MTQKISISSLASGGLITNYYCTSACGHCLYRCSPLWPKVYINAESAHIHLSIVKKLGCNSVHIGGGEPFLNPDGLLAVLDIAESLQIKINYVETNASWFMQTDHANDLLGRIARHGVSALLVSISPFHNEYIPFYKVKGVMDSCKNTGMIVHAWTNDFIDDVSQLDHTCTHSLDEYNSVYGSSYISDIPKRYWISPGGRALETFSRLEQGIAVPALLNCSRGGCTELLSVNHFHIDLFGNYIPGLCAGLSIKSEDLGSELDKMKYPIISILFNKGIRGFLYYAMDEYGFEPSKALYHSKCELCFEIRRFLTCSAEISSIELQPSQHYTLNQRHSQHV